MRLLSEKTNIAGKILTRNIEEIGVRHIIRQVATEKCCAIDYSAM